MRPREWGVNLLPFMDGTLKRYRVWLSVSSRENPGGWGKDFGFSYHLSFGRLWAHGGNSFHVKAPGVR